MKKYVVLLTMIFCSVKIQAQTAQDSLDIKRVALAYIESQHRPNPKLMEGALHPRMVKDRFLEINCTKRFYLRILCRKYGYTCRNL